MNNMMYLTSGQAARRLRVSVSSLKRWIDEQGASIPNRRNQNGWRLFTVDEIERIKSVKKRQKRNGRRFSKKTLLPLNSMK